MTRRVAFSGMYAVDGHAIKECELEVAASPIYNRTIAGKNASCPLAQIVIQWNDLTLRCWQTADEIQSDLAFSSEQSSLD